MKILLFAVAIGLVGYAAYRHLRRQPAAIPGPGRHDGQGLLTPDDMAVLVGIEQATTSSQQQGLIYDDGGELL